MKLHWYTKRILRLWAPAVIGIVVMLLAAMWGGQGLRFVLFTHHWFYFIAAMLLFNPVVQTFWPSKEVKRQRSVQRAKQASHQSEVSSRSAHRTFFVPSETALQRLARLRKEKAAVEQHIASLTAINKERSK
jgi:hypothetical protein